MVVRKGGPLLKIIRLEKKTEAQLHTTNIAPDFQERDLLLHKSNFIDQSILRNSNAPITDFMEGKILNELFEERI